jgi:integrase
VGIVGLQFRDLRRTFGSELLETTGVTLHHVRDALGHADIKTTSVYLSSTVKALEDVMRRRDAHRAVTEHDSHTTASDTPTAAPAATVENPANVLH